MKKLVVYVLQLAFNYLKAGGEDVRLVYDNPQGTLSFQGTVKYLKKLPIPKRNNG
jgi:hypothetical protein